MYVTTVTFTTAHSSITSVLNAIHLSLNSSIQKSHLRKKVAVNCARKIACFKKAVGYIGFRVTTSSVTPRQTALSRGARHSVVMLAAE